LLHFSAEIDGTPKVATNVWKEREEFYKSAMPKNQVEESYMLQRALEESQQQQQEMQMCELWQTDLSVSQL